MAEQPQGRSIATMNSSSTPAAVIAAASDHPRGRSFSAHPYEQEHPESTRSLPSAQRSPLWKMLKGTVAASAALRVRKQRSDSRLDADGITFEDRGSGSFKASTQLGKHADQWQSLAHFFDNGEGVARARTPAEQPSTPSTPRTLLAANRGRRLRSESPTPGPSRLPQTPSSHSAWPAFLPPPGTPTHTPARSDTVHQSPFSAEPGSYIVSDPDRIPEGDDPLSYHSNAASLIDSSSDEESDDEGQTGAEKNARFGKQASGGSAQAKPQGRITQTLRKWTPRFELTPLRKGILKCAVAYFVASLFTFSPYLSSRMSALLPHQDTQNPISNLHMIATVAVYFHPSKSLGAMLEADIFAFASFLYAALLGISSMAVAVVLHDWGMPHLSNVVSVLVFLGLGMGFVGWAKVKMGKPTFNTACSMIGVIVFTVVVKEGSAHLGRFSTNKIFQVTLVVVAGTIVTNLVCFLLWPQSACTNLQADINRNLQGFATLLKVLTKTFLLDDPSNFNYKSDRIKQAIDDHHASFTSLKKNLEEAKLEAPFDSRIRGISEKYVKVVDIMNRLAQHLAGLRSSCGLQHDIMMAQRRAREAGEGAMGLHTKATKMVALLANEHDGGGEGGAPAPASVPAPGTNGTVRGAELDRDREEGEREQKASAFEDFVQSVGPHMRSLVFTCDRTLKNLRTAFVSSSPSVSSHVSDSGARTSAHGVPAAAAAADNTDGPPIRRSRFVPGSSFDLLSEDLGAALRRFELEQTTAIKRIYTVHPSAAAPPADSDDESDDDSDAEDESDGHNPDYSSASLRSKSAAAASGGRARPRPRTPSHKHTGPSFDAKPDEEVFLMFFFVFNLDEFGKELENLVRAMEVIRREEGRIKRFRSLGVWSKCKEMLGWGDGERRAGMGRSARRAQGKKGWKRIGAWFPSLPTFSRSSGSFPNHRRHMENTAQTPIALTFAQRFQRFVWRLGEFLRLPDTKFAIKAGAGCAILASPAFMASTRPVFREYKGEWALVSFMVVLSPTVGQSNQMSVHRALGTIVGAAAAYGIYTLFPDNNIALPIFGLFFSLPCFRYIVGIPQYASTGRFVLLTYNLTALYSYNLRKVGIEVEQIAIHRTIAVIVGVVWATLLNHFLWPFEARRELANGVSELMFKLAWLYQRIVLSYSEQPQPQGQPVSTQAQPGSTSTSRSATLSSSGNGDMDDDDDRAHTEDPERQPLLASSGKEKEGKSEELIKEFQRMELHLQVTLIELEGLLSQTKNEPRLKGPFPVGTYKALLSCCQNILDKLHSMRCVTTRDAWYTDVRRDFVIPVNPQRREMVGNVLLFFYVLGSAFRLKTPVPPYFPPASHSRLRLIEKIRQLPVVKRRAVRGNSEYLLFYSYALAMKDVIDQLEELGRLTQANFGVVGGSVEAFEIQFRSSSPSASANHRISGGIKDTCAIR